MRFTAAITHESPWWVARCLEVEVTSQGESLEEARANLAEALALYFEDEPGDLSVGEAPIITPVDVDVSG
ncbi:MAG TPA: type II toxin-antitoxin system HicB family antitoxin [Acidimicrobiales bacterium]|nr:type II toxin-antitoxin system HicB family antitoxin [Acidimicrobiales bacterium]